MKAILVAGTNAGVGKTCIALGLMAAFARRGLRVQPFKVGPDFLDPIYHKAATGRVSYNLDSWMLTREVNLACFMQCIPFTDVAIVEGVMGLYDGRDGKSESGSTAEMAKLLGTPVLLVIDCWSLARSAAAVIRGYRTFDPEVSFAGVVFNKVGGSSHTAWLTEAVEATELGIDVLGGVPKSSDVSLPEKHLGEHFPTVDEISVNCIQALADLIDSHVNLDRILERSASLDLIPAEVTSRSPGADLISKPSVDQPKPVRIGVARDEAFCLYYEENLRLLQCAGAELVEFSPLLDNLPPRLDGIYFGGGYPELHLEKLSSNTSLLYAIRAFADAGGVIYGECGGLMYLSQGVEDEDQQKWSLCGVFPFWARMQPVLRMGYVTVTPQDNCMLFPASCGEIKGQIHHFCEIFYSPSNAISLSPRGFVVKAESQKATETLEGFMYGNCMVTFVHLHFGSNPGAAHSLVEHSRVITTKAAAVAAASASAVAAAGPVAAAAAGAAAAAAVAEAMGETKSLIPFRRRSESENSPFRRAESFDLSSMRQWRRNERKNGRLTRSESEVCIGASDQGSASYSSLGDFRRNSYEETVTSRSGFGSTKGKGYGVSENQVVVNPRNSRRRDSLETKVENLNAVVDNSRRKSLPPLTKNRKTLGWLANGESPKHLERSSSGGRVSTSSSTSRPPPERIVSLCPSATEVLIELGAEKRLIGVTESCTKLSRSGSDPYIVCRSRTDPGSRVQTYVEVPKFVGNARRRSSMRLDVSWLCKVKPDLIIIQDSSLEGDACSLSILGILAQAGLESGKNTFIMILKPHTVADALESIMDMGKRAGLYHDARLLGDWLRSRLRRAAATIARLHKPRVLIIHSLDPLLLGGHWVPEMISLSGGLDTLQRPGCDAESVLWRRILNYSPEVLVFALLSCSVDQAVKELERKLGRFSQFWSLPAVEAGRVYICEESYFSYPGPKLVDGVELLTGMLHPTAFPSRPISKAVLKLSLTSGQTCRPDQLASHFKPY